MLYAKYGQGSLQPCNGARGADGRSLDVIGEGVTIFCLEGTIFSHASEGITAVTLRGYSGQKILDSSQAQFRSINGPGQFQEAH